ncbi:MAG: transglycosylase domain-containing protein [Deferribacteraceae bacterium]|jgi:penicillin-binding protein 1A|nr:transglycosylase domain-containing protein [Deferribacteraceae bacterium]
MKILRNIIVFFIAIWSLGALALAVMIILWTEAGMVRLNVPEVNGLGVYADSIKLDMYDKHDNLIFRKNYFYGGRITPTDNLTLAGNIIELVRADSPPLQWWERIFLKLEHINPNTLESFVADYYTQNLIKVSRVSGIKKNILQWYTLQRLRGAYTQRELYALFLDSVHYSPEIHGIVGGAEAYFQKKFSELTPLETAYLIALVTSKPNTNDQAEIVRVSDKFARQFIYELYRKNIISLEEYKDETNATLAFAPQDYPSFEPSIINKTLESVRSYAKNININYTNTTTTIKTHYNHEATVAAKKALQSVYDEDPDIQAAFVMANVESGGIEVAIGSKVAESTRNRAFSSKRQMGSTFKPIVYAAALQRNYLPSDQLIDKPHVFIDGDTVYKPNNYNNFFMGQVPMRYGLIYSLNNATVSLAQKVGLQRVQQMAKNMGFQGYMYPYLATALGVFPTTPLNVAEIYATLANKGVTKPLSLIREVTHDNRSIQKDPEPTKRAMDGVTAYQTLYIMQDVARIGSARNANLLQGTAAKTGTSNNSKDLWTVAICYPYVIVAWFGYDNFTAMEERRSGGNTAAPVIAAFQREYFGDNTTFPLTPPKGIVFAPTRRDGKLVSKGGKGTYIEAFREGHLPQEAVEPAPKKQQKKKR